MQPYHIISTPDTNEATSTVPEAPAKALAETEAPIISAVTFSLESDGIYLPPQTLVLSCDTPDTVIRYELGAETVGEQSPLFDLTAPLILTQSTQITAQAFKDDLAGPLSTATYIIKGAVWQKREPEDQSDSVPHEVQESATLAGGWQLAVASTRGKLHAHRALWREDAFAWAQAGVSTICVVSDGAGSAPLSRVGSNLICHTIARQLEMVLENWHPAGVDEAELKAHELPFLRQCLIGAANAASEDLQRAANQRDCPLHDFAATLLLLVRCPWRTSTLYTALQVGDGAIALYSTDHSLVVMGVADHGEHSSETRFLTTQGVQADLPNRVSFCVRDDITACALLTDGVSDDFFPEDKRLGELFEALLPDFSTTEDAGTTVLNWLGYEKKGSSDDRTLLLLWKSPDGTMNEATPSDSTE